MAEREDQLRKEADLAREAVRQGDSGQPGGGQGRKDQTGTTNVYPASGPARVPGDAKLQPMGTWGQAGRAPEGYNDSGSSEVIPNERLSREKGKQSP